MSEDRLRPAAEAKAERARRVQAEGQEARAEYDAFRQSQDEQTARLRALRLEREKLVAAEAKPASKAKPKPKGPKRVRA